MKLLLLLTIGVSVLLTPTHLSAHGIRLFCWFEGDTLHGEGYFAGGDPVKNSRVSVIDRMEKNVLAETLTSGAGTFTLSLDQAVPFQVILDAGQGHRASWTWNGTREKEKPPDHRETESENTLPAIAAGLTVIALLFGFLYLWKRGHAA
ncbi:MAG: hypothetical protein ISR54_09870 [Chlorobium phaeobacteroides]|uniref:Uncharacterized protein n=1 Tax=Chlorobium phaeobacteroides (strain BS1) TaxID=331678 RepID=B3EQN7_CHLPB|nr:hypothetical protein [Chlorobium phaeobacteroides]NEX14747.1 hypothetical protein [Prosthecochloris sp.]